MKKLLLIAIIFFAFIGGFLLLNLITGGPAWIGYTDKETDLTLLACRPYIPQRQFAKTGSQIATGIDGAARQLTGDIWVRANGSASELADCLRAASNTPSALSASRENLKAKLNDVEQLIPGTIEYYNSLPAPAETQFRKDIFSGRQ